MEDCTPQCKGIKLLVFGGIIVLARLFTNWDMWLVAGILVGIMGIKMLVMPKCKCQEQKAQAPKAASSRKKK